MSDENRDERTQDEARLFAVYARLEKEQTRSYSASFDLAAGLERFMTWLDDQPGEEPPVFPTIQPLSADGIRFRILGPLEVRTGDNWQAIGARKSRAMLAALLLHSGQVITVDQLIHEIWEDEPPEKARKTVLVYAYRIRRLIGDSSAALLAVRPHGYELRIGRGALDATVFIDLVEEGRRALAAGSAERASVLLTEALGLWRGSPLADVSPTPLVHHASARLQTDRLIAMTLRIEAEIACGRSADALISELRNIVFSQPHRQDWWGLLMVALDKVGPPTEAARAYEQLRVLVPADPDPEATYRKAIDLDPHDAASHHGLGHALYERGRYGEAAAAYREAIRLNPADPASHIHLGDALLSLDRFSEGIAAYRQAIRLEPVNAMTHVRLGDALCARNSFEEAEAAYREAIRLDPTSAETYGRLGYALAEQERHSESVAAYREAIRLDPANAASIAGLGAELGKKRERVFPKAPRPDLER